MKSFLTMGKSSYFSIDWKKESEILKKTNDGEILTTFELVLAEKSIEDKDCCRSDDERLCSLSRTIWRILGWACSGANEVAFKDIERLTDNDERQLLIISFNSLTLFFSCVFSKTKASIWRSRKAYLEREEWQCTVWFAVLSFCSALAWAYLACSTIECAD